jgi:Putative Flp pilus-assembly TadE/G-like
MRDLKVRGEQGSVLIITAVFLPVALLFGAFVVDTGNWWVHKRHLQIQADSAALAAAQEFRYPCDSTVDATITSVANSYGGATYNAPLKQTTASNRHELVNAPNYYNQTKPADSDLTGSPPPCKAGFVDVKMTETDLPWFLAKSKVVHFINAQARVAVKALSASDKTLPVAAIEPDPKAIKATLYDANKQVIGTALLDNCVASGGSKLCDSSKHKLSVKMDNSAGTLDYSHMTVKMAVSGTTDTTCGNPLVSCYDNLLWIRGWSDQPTVGIHDEPRLRSVALLNGGCSDAYFTDGTSCNATINAVIDWQAGVPLTGTTAPQVTASVSGGSPISLTAPSTAGQPWTGTIPVPANAGTVPITLDWVQRQGTIVHGTTTDTCTTQNTGTGNNKNPCFGNFEGPYQPSNNATRTTIQQPFSASSTGSGPLASVQIGEELTPGVFTYDENNLQRCSSTYTCPTRDFVFRVRIPGTLQLAQPSDPPVALRVVGNQNQTVDCDPNVPNLRQELELPTSPTDLTHGCHPQYTGIGPGQTCPANSTTLWGTTQPWYCVAISTGGAVGQVGQGLNQRLEGSETGAFGCPNKNNWPNYPSNDPRIIEVFVTPYGSFNGSGGGTVPVLGLAAFYVTGWQGNGSSVNPCTGYDNDIAPGFASDNGVVSGHFIKYVDPGGKPGPSDCSLTDPSDIFACVPVMTK